MVFVPHYKSEPQSDFECRGVIGLNKATFKTLECDVYVRIYRKIASTRSKYYKYIKRLLPATMLAASLKDDGTNISWQTATILSASGSR